MQNSRKKCMGEIKKKKRKRERKRIQRAISIHFFFSLVVDAPQELPILESFIDCFPLGINMKYELTCLVFLVFSFFPFFFFFFFFLSRAVPAAYGSFQARGQIRATAAGLHHNHRNIESELNP